MCIRDRVMGIVLRMIPIGLCQVVSDHVVGRAGDSSVMDGRTQIRRPEGAVVKVKELMFLLLALSAQGFGTVGTMYVCKKTR